jgi:DNA-directed RNA polymerase subunit delta
MERENDLVLFRNYGNPLIAQFHKALLEQNGIPCVIKDLGFNFPTAFFSDSNAGIKILVRNRDLISAFDLMSEEDDDDLDFDTDIDDDQDEDLDIEFDDDDDFDEDDFDEDDLRFDDKDINEGFELDEDFPDDFDEESLFDDDDDDFGFDEESEEE